MATPDFCRSVNSISTREWGADHAHQIPYARHHRPLLIRIRSWIQAIHKAYGMLKLEGIYKLLRTHNLSAWELKKSTSFSPLFLLVWSCFFFPMLGIEREVDRSFFNFLIIDNLFPLCFFIMLISLGFFISGYLFFISSSISIAIWKKKKFTIRGFFC